MKKLIAAVALLISVQYAHANINVDNIYIPQAPPGSMAHAAYLTVSNSGRESRTVVGVSSPVFGMVHLHHTMMKDGMSSMESMGELVIEPGQTITLEPGGMHIMLMKPKQDAMVTGVVPLLLYFKNGDTVEVTASVRALN